MTPAFEHLASFEHLLEAFHRAARGKRAHRPVAQFEYNLADRLISLGRALLAGAYRPGGYVHFTIHEPKRRRISAAPFVDRVVHHAWCMIVEPRFERLFCHDSYANRVGKGTHAALNRLQALALRHRYVLRCDIVRHFPSVDHQILLDVVSRVVPEPDVMALGRAILASGADVDQDDAPTPFPGDDLLALCRPRGLPIGNLTSQFWSNCYLHPFDEFVRRELRCRSYVRYVDDFALFADDKGTLHEWKSAVSRRLSRYRLFIHGNQAQPVPVTGGIPWLGFVVYPTHRRLKRRKVVHATRRLRAAFVRYQDRQLERKELNAKLRGWIQHARHGDTWGLRRHMFSQPWCTARVVSAH